MFKIPLHLGVEGTLEKTLDCFKYKGVGQPRHKRQSVGASSCYVLSPASAAPGVQAVQPVAGTGVTVARPPSLVGRGPSLATSPRNLAVSETPTTTLFSQSSLASSLIH